jgi:multisubunit Na+/H+ antiporter MnhB subunit
MGWALLHGLQQGASGRLAGAVAAQLDASGVSNPVTAVLLNFRAYDTLLELAVLLVALLGILSLGETRPAYRIAGPVLSGLTAWLVPLLILMAGYQLWVGAHAPGGAFQAGALLAAAGVVLHLAGHQGAGLPGGAALRAVAVSGVGIFLAVGLATLWLSSAFLAYPAGWAGGLILMIEGFATLAIAATLILAYLGGKPDHWHEAAARSTKK